MSVLWHGKRWTEDEVNDITKAAIRKKYEADAALLAAAEIETEFWTRELVEQFPELQSDYDENSIDIYALGEWREKQHFLCEVEWDDKKETCIIGTPTRNRRFGNYPHATVDVWFERAKKGKKAVFLKEAHTMRCSEIIPCITKLESLAKLRAKKEKSVLKQKPQADSPNAKEQSIKEQSLNE